MRRAGLSVDVDSVACHLEGYGFHRPRDTGEAYELAVPRALDLFQRIGVRATFFLIGQEAGQRPAVVREIVRQGHEVASHSLTHTVPFLDLGAGSIRAEVRLSKRILENVSGAEVVGFRAPSWDISDELRSELSAAGYTYDASAFPSIMLPALRWSVARRSTSARKIDVAGTVRAMIGRTEPHVEGNDEDEIVVIPLATTPVLRLPFYHTMRFLLPPLTFARIERSALRHRSCPTYVMHAVDFLGVVEDGLDPRISRHPGMSLALDAKLAMAAEAVGVLASGRNVIPLREISQSVCRQKSRSTQPV